MWKFFGGLFLGLSGFVCWCMCRVSAMAEREWERIMRLKGLADGLDAESENGSDGEMDGR